MSLLTFFGLATSDGVGGALVTLAVAGAVGLLVGFWRFRRRGTLGK